MKKGWIVWSTTVFSALLLTVTVSLVAPEKQFYRFLINTLKFGYHKRVAAPYIQAFFPPRDRVQQLVCELIDEESERIDIAAYHLTNDAIAKALYQAYRRKVLVTLVVDQSALGRYSKVLDLYNEGVPVYVYDAAEQGRKDALMHNKIMLLHSLQCIITGSMNFTKSGTDSNQENLLIIQYQPLFEEYAQQLAYLKLLSQRLGESKRMKKLS